MSPPAQRVGPGPGRWKGLALGAAVAGASFGIAVLAAELALAIADYPPAYGDHQRMFVEYDSIRGWRNIAGGRGRFVTPQFAVELEYNARSYRGPLHDYAKPAGVERILLLGDSYLEGYTVELDDRVAEVAERLLNADTTGRVVEVIALGTAGYSTDQELLWLETEGLRYEPDLVILLFVTNDFWFNIQSTYTRGHKPLFVRIGDSLVLSNVPLPRRSIEPDPTPERPVSALRAIRRFVRDRSHLLRLAERALDRSVWLRSAGARLGLSDAPTVSVRTDRGEIAIPVEFSVFADSLSPAAERALEITARLLARMDQTASEAGAALRVVLVPANDAVYPPGARQSASFHRVSPVGDEHRPAERFRDVCRAANVACVDPTAEFVAAAESLAAHDELLIVPDDGHWNERGHGVAAHVIADVARGVLDSTGSR